MKKAAVILFSLLVFPAVSCYADGLGTLIQVGKSMDDAERKFAEETAVFEKVKAGVEGDAIKKGLPQSAIIKQYGYPQVAIQDAKSKREKWVYKPGSSTYFEGIKIYLFFDSEGLLDETQVVNKQGGSDDTR